MNEDIGQQILNELKNANRWNRFGIVFALSLLLSFTVCLMVIRHSRQSAAAAKAAQTLPWREVSDAWDKCDYPKAVKLVRRIIDRQPGYYYGYAYLGNIYLSMDDVTNAAAQYAKAYELLPSEDNEKMLTAIRKRLANEQAAQTSSKL